MGRSAKSLFGVDLFRGARADGKPGVLLTFLAVATLVKPMPAPLRNLAGDLSDAMRARVALDIPLATPATPATSYDIQREAP